MHLHGTFTKIRGGRVLGLRSWSENNVPGDRSGQCSGRERRARVLWLATNLAYAVVAALLLL